MKRMMSNWAIMGLLFLTGCATIGPGTIPRDRFDYTTAIGESWKNQMLLNIVKIRYGDTPVFLDVASVINQYSIQGQITLGAGWTSSPAANSQSIGGYYFWIDDRDRPPKVTFTFLMILLSLIETGGAPTVPPVTIPVG